MKVIHYDAYHRLFADLFVQVVLFVLVALVNYLYRQIFVSGDYLKQNGVELGLILRLLNLYGFDALGYLVQFWYLVLKMLSRDHGYDIQVHLDFVVGVMLLYTP